MLCHVDGSLSSTELAPTAPNGTDSLMNMHEMSVTADGPVGKSQPIRTQSTPVRHGAHLTLSDHERLRVFIHEFVMHGLIPWAEKTIRTLNEQVNKSFLALLRTGCVNTTRDVKQNLKIRSLVYRFELHLVFRYLLLDL